MKNTEIFFLLDNMGVLCGDGQPRPIVHDLVHHHGVIFHLLLKLLVLLIAALSLLQRLNV